MFKRIQRASSAQLWCIEVLGQVIGLSQVIIVQLFADGLLTKMLQTVQHVLVSSAKQVFCNIVRNLC